MLPILPVVLLASLLVINAASAAETVPGPSFDCAKASAPLDKLICSDPPLADLDRRLATTFRQRMETAADRDELLGQQRIWLKARAPSCGLAAEGELPEGQIAVTATNCIAQLYRLRIGVLAPPPVSAPVPAQAQPPASTAARLRDLREENYIRPATQTDFDDWLQGVPSRVDRFGRYLKPSIDFPLDRTWVVLKEVDLGTDLAEGDGVAFIVPRGVPRPYGARGPAPIYLMDGSICRGQHCPTTVPPSTWTGWSHAVPSWSDLHQNLRNCVLPVPGNAVVYGASAYRGGLPTTRPIGGNDPARIDVAVTETTRPVALLLAGNSTVEWRIGVKPGAKLAAVFITGAKLGSVVGVDRSVPVIITSAEDMQSNACSASGLRFSPNDPIFYDAPLDSLALMIFGRSLYDIAMGPTIEKVVAGPGPFPPVDQLYFSLDRGNPSAVDPEPIAGGLAGLAQLSDRGLVRRATNAELLAWVEGYEKIVGHHVLLSGQGNAWMITGAKKLPSHPGGWNNIFILPAGAEMPIDSSHTWAIMRMQDFSCMGGDCLALLSSSGPSTILRSGQRPMEEQAPH